MRNDLMQLVEDVFARSEEIGEDSWYNAEELHAISNGAISMPDARFIAAFTPVGVRGLLNGAVQAAPQAAGNAGELTLENAPIGTKAPAISGGNWVRTERGWTWCTGSTFPRPGGDWNGQLIAPVERPTATQAAPAGELAAHLKTADDCFAAAEAEGLTHVLQDSTDERLKDLVIRRLMWARDSIQAAQATLGTQAAPVLGGWKLTPHEPTPEMIAAGREQWHRIGTTTDAWQAMWHAAPATPGEQP